MTRTTSIVLLSIITVLVLFLGVFSFIGTFNVGEFEKYYSPSYLIQKSNGLTDSVEYTYLVDLDDDVDFAAVKKVINKRLRSAYGYYGVSIDYDEAEELATFRIPQTNNNSNITANTILSNVVANGNIEILDSSSYSESSVVLTYEHFKSARVRSYVNGSYTWYLVEIKLTGDGSKIADGSFVEGSTYYFAVDGDVDSMADYNGGRVRLYAHSKDEAKLFASYINAGGPLNATLTENDVSDPIKGFGWVFLMIVGVFFVGSLVYFVVRFKDLGLVAALGQLLAVVIFTIFAGLVHLEILNVFAAIGILLVYCFMSFFTMHPFEKIRSYLKDGKTYTSARYKGFLDTWKVNLIAHGALLLLGVILWVIPTAFTAPLGNVFVYGALLSFVVTFGLNRLFTHMLSPFHEGRPVARNAKKK